MTLRPYIFDYLYARQRCIWKYKEKFNICVSTSFVGLLSWCASTVVNGRNPKNGLICKYRIYIVLCTEKLYNKWIYWNFTNRTYLLLPSITSIQFKGQNCLHNRLYPLYAIIIILFWIMISCLLNSVSHYTQLNTKLHYFICFWNIIQLTFN